MTESRAFSPCPAVGHTRHTPRRWRAPLMLGTALGAILTMGYARGAYAQQVCTGGPSAFTCSGA